MGTLLAVAALSILTKDSHKTLKFEESNPRRKGKVGDLCELTKVVAAFLTL